MEGLFKPLDLVLFFGSLVAAMAVGMWAGRKEKSTEDYFLAGRKIRWFGVAASIFGSNVSANHLISMLGIGFSFGFAQSHFEIGAIAGLMVLCYGFLPVYRKLKVFTLSEYLGQRYDDRSRVCYAIIMVLIMVGVQLVPALYIGARSICILGGGDLVNTVATASGESVDEVNMVYYSLFVVVIAAVSASYTIFGGLIAVVWTDVIQSVLLLVGGLILAFLGFYHIGGWGEMMRLDAAAAGGAERMHLYLPPNHAKLPWPGVLTGLMAMHCFYWGTNQFIVQRALGARSDTEAKLGIISAGFLKLLIPFFSIAAGVAAFYLFRERLPGREIAPDTAFTELVKLVVPVGYGLVGLIFAGVLGAILSSIDSMMNSAATIISVDIYKRYFRPNAGDREMVLVGRLSILTFVVLAALMAIFVLDPNSKANFFLTIADHQNYLTPGLLVAFFLGMFWRRSTPMAGFLTIVTGVFFSWLVPILYESETFAGFGLAPYLGVKLNFFYRVVAVIGLCTVLHILVSKVTRHDPEKEKLTWTALGGHAAGTFPRVLAALGISVVVYAVLGALMYNEVLSPQLCAWAGAAWTLILIWGVGLRRRLRASPGTEVAFVKSDHCWSGLLCAVAIFMMYYFY